MLIKTKLIIIEFRLTLDLRMKKLQASSLIMCLLPVCTNKTPVVLKICNRLTNLVIFCIGGEIQATSFSHECKKIIDTGCTTAIEIRVESIAIQMTKEGKQIDWETVFRPVLFLGNVLVIDMPIFHINFFRAIICYLYQGWSRNKWIGVF